MKQVHVIISGTVQGVGYRYFVKSWARQFGITGWVGNMADGRVEGIFKGDDRAIENLIEKCRKGPFLSEVKNIDVNDQDTEEVFEDFRITS